MSVKVSAKYQVLIPKEVRAALGLKAGSMVEIIVKGKVAYLAPVPSLEEVQEALLRDKRDRT